MSTKSTAGQLARLKVTYPLWRIYRYPLDGEDVGGDVGDAFMADERYGKRHLVGLTVADLENQLIRAAYG